MPKEQGRYELPCPDPIAKQVYSSVHLPDTMKPKDEQKIAKTQ